MYHQSPFSKEGKGNINEYLERYLYDLENVKDKGYIGMITGNHDMQRLAYQRDVEEIKTAMVFLFTMPGVPFVYYGDEIGMDYIENLLSKEGGYNRTGARTPMQWGEGKNHQFSPSDTPYLPTDSRPEAPTVEKQLSDKNSLLNFVKKLIELHKTIPALYAESGFNILFRDYPFVYERTDGQKTIFVAVNPSARSCDYSAPAFKKVILSQNVEQKEGFITMNGVSFIVAEKLNS